MTALLIEHLFPLYILIGLGYVAGRWLEVNLHSLATVAIFIFSPVVVFGAIMKIELDPAYLLLPLVIYVIACCIAITAYKTSHWHLKSNLANLIGMASGTGNTGYFGLPVVLALLGPEAAGVYILMNLAATLCEVTCSYYIGARGNHAVAESLKKVIRLPALHAAWIALLCNASGVVMPEIFGTYWNYFTGAWIIVGMMLIGVGLAKVETMHLNFRLLAWMFGFRFIVWPLAMLAVVTADRLWLGLYNEDVHLMMMVIGLVPLAANTVAFAGYLRLPASEAALAVLLSTIFALFYIPFMLSLFS